MKKNLEKKQLKYLSILNDIYENELKDFINKKN